MSSLPLFSYGPSQLALVIICLGVHQGRAMWSLNVAGGPTSWIESYGSCGSCLYHEVRNYPAFDLVHEFHLLVLNMVVHLYEMRNRTRINLRRTRGDDCNHQD
jgi:hypothetical protein